MPKRFEPNTQYPHLSGSSKVSLSDIQAQFGGSHPISLSEYYKGGSLVSDSDGLYLTGSKLTPVPSAQRIGINDFVVRPFLDQVYTVDGGVSLYTFNIPENCGYTNMKVMIQGAGGSGTSGFKAVSGWGHNVPSNRFSPAAGGNGGDYAIKYSTPISGGQVISIQVGTGTSLETGYSTNQGLTGEIGAKYPNGNGSNGGDSYVLLNGTQVMLVPGGKTATSGSMAIKWYDASQMASAFAQPPAPNASNIQGADYIQLAGRGGLAHYPSAYGYYSYLGTNNWYMNNLNMNNLTCGGGGAAGGYNQETGYAAPPTDPYQLQGRGYMNATGAGGVELYRTWMEELYSNTLPNDKLWYGGSGGIGSFASRGAGVSMIGKHSFQAAPLGGYGSGGGGAATGYNSTHRPGNAGFVRIMFYDNSTGSAHLDSDGVSQATKYITSSPTPWT